METQNTCDITLNVLGYKEDSEWVALALEMDLRGYGSTFQEALKDLVNLVEMQVSFSEYKGQPDMAYHPAEATYWTLFSQLREDRLRHLAKAREATTEYEICGIPVPPAHVIQDQKNKFSIANG